MDKIICFGKNYQDHMLELGDKPVTEPVIFLKPPSILRQCQNWGDAINVLLTEHETHYECELVIKMCEGGYKMTYDAAKLAIGAYTVGLDMTLRKVQAGLKEKGHPWTIAKVFPDACIIGPWIDGMNNNVGDMPFMDTIFQFTLDGKLKQKSCGGNMMFNPIELIVYASKFFPLCAGDVLFTGTPKGVGAVKEKSVGVLAIDTHEYSVKWG